MSSAQQPSPAIKKKRTRRKMSELVRPFRCEHGACSKAYATRAALALHVKLKHESPVPLTSWSELQHSEAISQQTMQTAPVAERARDIAAVAAVAVPTSMPSKARERIVAAAAVAVCSNGLSSSTALPPTIYIDEAAARRSATAARAAQRHAALASTGTVSSTPPASASTALAVWGAPCTSQTTTTKARARARSRSRDSSSSSSSSSSSGSCGSASNSAPNSGTSTPALRFSGDVDDDEVAAVLLTELSVRGQEQVNGGKAVTVASQ